MSREKRLRRMSKREDNVITCELLCMGRVVGQDDLLMSYSIEDGLPLVPVVWAFTS